MLKWLKNKWDKYHKLDTIYTENKDLKGEWVKANNSTENTHCNSRKTWRKHSEISCFNLILVGKQPDCDVEIPQFWFVAIAPGGVIRGIPILWLYNVLPSNLYNSYEIHMIIWVA